MTSIQPPNATLWDVEPQGETGFRRIFLQRTSRSMPLPSPFHSHTGAQVCLVRCGAGGVSVLSPAGKSIAGRFAMAPGDAILFPARQPHAWTDVSPEGLDVLAFNLCPRHSPVSRVVLSALSTPGPLSQIASHESLIPLIQAIELEARAERLERAQMIAALGRQLLIEMARVRMQQPASAIAAKSSLAVARARAFMAGHLEKPLSAEEIAGTSGLGASQLARRFQHELGESPAIVLRRLRLDRARQLLAATDEPLESVAKACGLSCAQHLCRVFRTATGQTPQSYRLSKKSPSFG